MREPNRLRTYFDDLALHSTAELEANGFNRTSLRRLVEEGAIIQFTRGIYISPDGLMQDNLSLAAMSMLRNGAVCLLSAASYHNLGDETPPEVWYAVDRTRIKNARVPSFEYGHQLVFWNPELFQIGLEEIEVAGQTISITSPARTIVDLLHARNKLTEEVALRAFSDYLKNDGDIREVSSIAYSLGRYETLSPYINLADELKEAIPTRRGP